VALSKNEPLAKDRECARLRKQSLGGAR
jgi:hypothetical protein